MLAIPHDPIAVVVPTVRPEKFQGFLKSWEPLFTEHQITLFKVTDGEVPMLEVTRYDGSNARGPFFFIHHVMRFDKTSDYSDLIFNFTDSVRNLGFAAIARCFPEIKYIITLDDDVTPIGDPIQDHIDILKKKVPISWISTAEPYMRGFPYWVREEAEVMVSHGVWLGEPDLDAPTQLVNGFPKQIKFYKGPVPRGIYAPFCGMAVGFRREALDIMMYAPMGKSTPFPEVNRFGDIFLGVTLVDELAKRNQALVTGYSTIYHARASDLWKNLVAEAPGIKMNEHFFTGGSDHPYFKFYAEKRARWKEFIEKVQSPSSFATVPFYDFIDLMGELIATDADAWEPEDMDKISAFSVVKKAVDKENNKSVNEDALQKCLYPMQKAEDNRKEVCPPSTTWSVEEFIDGYRQYLLDRLKWSEWSPVDSAGIQIRAKLALDGGVSGVEVLSHNPKPPAWEWPLK